MTQPIIESVGLEERQEKEEIDFAFRKGKKEPIKRSAQKSVIGSYDEAHAKRKKGKDNACSPQKISKSVLPPRPVPHLNQTLVTQPAQDQDAVFSMCSVAPQNDASRVESSRTIQESQLCSEEWPKELKSKYAESAREKQRKIAEEEIKLKVFAERRQARDENLEKQIRERLQLTELVKPAVEEPVIEVEDEEEEDKQKVEEFPELTPEMEKKINYALRRQPAGEILVEAFRLQLTRNDFATLSGLSWLNDEIINFYMNMLIERGELDNYPKVYAFNTFFYPKIMSAGYSAVRRWTKSIDIFSKDFLVIPVHLRMHWCLCVVDFKKKNILYYDSMGGNNYQCLEATKKYLCDEMMDKKQQKFDLSGWKTEIVKDIPQQMNGSDCGMFACKYAEYITRRAPITFTQEHMPYFRQRMVYEILTKKLL